MMIDILKNIIVNISTLVLAAHVMFRVRFVKDYIYNNQRRLSYKIILAVIFGLLGILATYTGISINGAIANTRAISIVAAGILGGPFVGIGAGVIAGLHRFGMDPTGFTALACGVSTIVEGALGGFLHQSYQRSPSKPLRALEIAGMAEIAQMLIILCLARPFHEALELVKLISFPMVVFNSLGVTIFVGIFESVYAEQDLESARRTKQALVIADQCLPYLRKGLHNRKNLGKATDIIASIPGIKGVVITDRTRVLSCGGISVADDTTLPGIALETLQTGHCQIFSGGSVGQDFPEANKLWPITAPLTIQEEVIGCLILFIERYKMTSETESSFVSGLAKLFSTQLELELVDYQKQLLRIAEFNALQSQINPHFLFNALSTISAFCREKPERARELLIILGDYLRKSLESGDYMISLQDEFRYVNCYLQLEKARFEEKLQIELDLPDGIVCSVPRLILQPIVENAVKHGVTGNQGKRNVFISARQDAVSTRITVRDTGTGIPPDVVQSLYSGTMDKTKIGLANVHKRLLSIYGAEYGLEIQSDYMVGTSVTITIPTAHGGEGFEDRDCG